MEDKVLVILSYLSCIERLDPKDTLDCISIHKNSMKQLRHKCNQYYESSKKINLSFWKLPSIVLHNILKELDHFSLIMFAFAFPCLRNTVIQPVYWKELLLNLHADVLEYEEIITITNYFKNFLKSLDVNLNGLNEREVFRTAKEIFENNSFLEKLKLQFMDDSYIIDKVCQSLTSLKELELSFKNLNDDHIIQITHCIRTLKSLIICSDNEISYGLEYFLERSSNITGFGFTLPRASKKVFSLMVQNHRKTLMRVEIGMHEVLIDEAFMCNLKEFPKLKNLCIYNFFCDEPLSDIMDELEGLESLRLIRKLSDTHYFTTKLFSKPKLRLKKLGLQKIAVGADGLRVLGECCSNMEILTVNDCNVSPLGLIEALQFMKKLQNLNIKQTSCDNFLLSQFLLRPIAIGTLYSLKRFTLLTNTGEIANKDQILIKCTWLLRLSEFEFLIECDNEVYFNKFWRKSLPMLKIYNLPKI